MEMFPRALDSMHREDKVSFSRNKKLSHRGTLKPLWVIDEA